MFLSVSFMYHTTSWNTCYRYYCNFSWR